MKDTQFKLWRWTPVTASAVLMIVIVFISVRTVSELRTATYRREHTFQVLLDTQALEDSLVDAQDGERGYLQTGQPRLLVEYKTETNAEIEELSRLDELTRNDPSQQVRLKELAAAIKAVFAHDDQVIGVYARQGVPTALKSEQDAESWNVTDRAIHDLENFSNEEKNLLATQDATEQTDYLGFGGANEPEAGASNKEKQRRIEALKAACQRKIGGDLLTALQAAIKSKVRHDDTWSLHSDEDDPDRQTLLFDYPTSFAPDTAAYIRRSVKIEMGARADHWPSETKTITPYVAEKFPTGFREPNCALKVLSVERTFWEKATILHAEFHRPADKAMPERFSRHYGDFYELIHKGVSKSATIKLDLLARVAQHKSLFFKSSWAKYGEAAKGTLRVVPPEHRLKALREDHQKMQQMFFGEPPEFDKIIALLNQWESEFNQK